MAYHAFSVHDLSNLTFLKSGGDRAEVAFLLFGMGEFYSSLLFFGQERFLEIQPRPCKHTDHTKVHTLSLVLLQDATVVMISFLMYKGTFKRGFGEIICNV